MGWIFDNVGRLIARLQRRDTPVSRSLHVLIEANGVASLPLSNICVVKPAGLTIAVDHKSGK
jgi:hypothetical protein